jgi:PTH1 family peptidyl-tRNA hydrolase
MKAIIGLGNPGREYKDTRHNIGFSVIEAIADDKRISLKKNLFNSLTGIGKIKKKEVILAKPVTFMNLSGKAVKALVKGKQIALKDVLIVCDDVNLPIGNMRFRASGSEGGHNGLKSISKELGSTDYARLRIGVNESLETSKENLASYVLAAPSKKDQALIKDMIGKARNSVYDWINYDINYCMNFYNKKVTK